MTVALPRWEQGEVLQTGERYAVEPGYEFPARELVVTPAFQRRYHDLIRIAPTVHGDRVDPTFLGRYPIRVIGEAIFACHPGRGYVHMVQRIRQHAPARLGEPIAVTGRFTRVDEAPRGWMVEAAFDYRNADGTLLMTVEPRALMADPTRMPAPESQTAKQARSEPDPALAGWVALTSKQLTPDMVTGYSADGRNLIHLDLDYARRFGFRTPIAAGNMAINFLLEGIALGGRPDRMDVEIKFPRPVFWDDKLTVYGRYGLNGKKRLVELIAVKADGNKVTGTCRVDDLAGPG
ncbi:MAG: hypothetical protein EXQ87_07975 [Alphaproteobacteria bacterium]|nr:hypothetical protein [Alphaproteobacteria bacterium]